MQRRAVLRIQKNAYKLHQKKLPLIPKLLQHFNRILFSCDIPYSLNVPQSLNLGHNGLGVIIHPESVLGENILIMQHVTIGGNFDKKKTIQGVDYTAPIIGDNVFIGPGAQILGPVSIGNNVKIGANSIVLHDIPSNCIAAGNPAKIIKRI